jgi:hypothetical protein
VAEVSYPASTYNSGAVTDAEYQRLPWAGDGLLGGPGDASDAVYANSSGREIHIRANRYGKVLGRTWASGSADLTIPVAANSSGSARVDTVVLRLDRSTWLVRAAVRAGTPGSGAPALQRSLADTGLWEVPLADITVPNGATVLAGTAVKTRPLYQPGALRPAKALADVSGLVSPGDITYAAGAWYGYNGSKQVALYEDTGWVPVDISWPTVWQDGDIQVRRRAGMVTLRMAATRKLILGKADPDGNQLCILPNGYRPDIYQDTTASFFGTTGGIAAHITVRSDDGSVWMLAPTADIQPGRSFRATITFPAA